MTKLSVRLGLVVVAIAAALLAQGGASISGKVVDATGAAVPNATIIITNTHTNAVRTARTDQFGQYTVVSLNPGLYHVEVEAPGFRKYSRRDIGLQVDQRQRIDPTLQVGEVTETIDVVGDTIAVNTVDAVIRTVVDQRRVADLPLNGRSPLQLMTLVPGVHAIEGSAARGIGTSFTPAGQQFVGSSGSRGNEINFVLDGGYNQDDYRNLSNAFPNPDFLQEFSLQTNNFGAEYGRFSGGVANAVTKSGTNEFHGTAFDFLRNNALNARNFFAPIDDGLKRNQWGATVGGPVRLPGYNGRDRTFFFFGYQGTKIRQRPSTATATVPTARQRTGDFGDFFDSRGALIIVRDPDTGQPFPGNVIPGNRIDPVIPKLLEFIPVAQDPDGTVRFQQQTIFDGYEFQARVDHNFTSKDRLFGRIFRQLLTRPNTGVSGNLLSYATAQVNGAVNGRLQYDRTLSPAALLTLGFTYNRSAGLRQGTTPVTWQELGVNAPPAGSTDDFLLDTSPFFEVVLFGDTPLVRNAFQYQATMATVKGRHNLRYGFEANRRQFNIPIVNVGFHGAFEFTRGITGSPLSDFILGRPTNFNQSSGFQESLRQTDWVGWISDEIKVNRRFTMTLGLRFEPFLPWVDRWRKGFPQVARYIPGQQSRVFSKIPTGMNFYGDPEVPERIAEGDVTKFSPRIGLAFDPFGDGSTSIRAGYGIFRLGFPGVQTQSINSSIPAFNASVNIDLPASVSNPFQGQAPPPWPAKIVPFDAEFPFLVSGAVTQQKMDQPYTQQWNLTVERQLLGSWVATISYQGSKGSKLFSGSQANYARYMPGSSTLGNIQQRRLDPKLGSIAMLHSAGWSQYHALVLSGSKRLTKSYSVLASYTWSKLIDHGRAEGEGISVLPPANPFNWALDKAVADYHHDHIAALSYVWELPSLKNRNPVLRGIFGEWQNNGIVRLQSGEYQSPVSSFGNSLTGIGSDRADLVGDPRLPSGRSKSEQVNQWFNTKSFIRNAEGTFGSSGRNILEGPGLANVDLSLFKNIPLGSERVRLQLRSEFFNILNHVNFNQPAANVDSGNFGRIQSARDPRIIQFALKFIF